MPEIIFTEKVQIFFQNAVVLLLEIPAVYVLNDVTVTIYERSNVPTEAL